MKKKSLYGFWCFLCITCISLPLQADKSYQNFEPDNGSGQYGWGFNGAQASLSDLTEPSHSGERCWKVTSPWHWGGTGIPSQVETWNFSAVPAANDRLII